MKIGLCSMAETFPTYCVPDRLNRSCIIVVTAEDECEVTTTTTTTAAAAFINIKQK
jgi:hypothetical protein